jgi:hypothetical protein
MCICLHGNKNTQVVQDENSPTWNETFTFVVTDITATLTLTSLHKFALFKVFFFCDVHKRLFRCNGMGWDGWMAVNFRIRSRVER